ncbi:hypothetical protein HOD29_04470 [archaeon]|jgi:hypothetical protein|nr:hypothetical protein [archaeon]
MDKNPNTLTEKDFHNLFMQMPNYDLANEFVAYTTEKDKSTPEYRVLQTEIERRKNSKTKLEKWVKDHKLTKTDGGDLDFKHYLDIRGITPGQGDLAAIKIAITDAYGYTDLWTGKKPDKGPEGTTVMKGYTQDIWYKDPDHIRSFAIKRYNQAEGILERLNQK